MPGNGHQFGQQESLKHRKPARNEVRARTPVKAVLPQPQPSTATSVRQEALSIAERIRQIGHAMTAQQLAEILNVSKVTIFKQAKAGRIPSFRVGSCVRFCPQAIVKWLVRQ